MDRERLKIQIEAIAAIANLPPCSPEFRAWRKRTEETLEVLFSRDSSNVQDFNAIYYTPVFLTCRMGDEAFDEAYRNGLEEARVFLLSVMDKIRRPA